MNYRKVFSYVYSFGDDKPHRQYFEGDYFKCYYILDSRSASGILCEVDINKMNYYEI